MPVHLLLRFAAAEVKVCRGGEGAECLGAHSDRLGHEDQTGSAGERRDQCRPL